MFADRGREGSQTFGRPKYLFFSLAKIKKTTYIKNNIQSYLYNRIRKS